MEPPSSKSCDIRMLQRCKDLAFGFETAEDLRAVGAHADDLQRHLFTELQISPLPKEDGPHAAFTQQPKNSR
jgi:hypothetical protein